MTLAGWIAKKREELRCQPAVPLRELTPSIRDFAHAITTRREAIAVIGGVRGGGAVKERCRALDEAGVSAIAAATDGLLLAPRTADRRAGKRAASADDPEPRNHLQTGRKFARPGGDC